MNQLEIDERELILTALDNTNDVLMELIEFVKKNYPNRKIYYPNVDYVKKATEHSQMVIKYVEEVSKRYT
jgi:hypothetical protein